MSNFVRLWAAAAGAVMALASAPVALMTIASPAMSWADVCADAGGRHVDVAGCTDPGAAVYVAPPADDPQVVRVLVNRVRLERTRQFGACYLGLELWRRLELDRFFEPALDDDPAEVPWSRDPQTRRAVSGGHAAQPDEAV